MRVDEIEIHAGTVDFQYEAIRPLEVKCESRTVLSKTPTINEANAKLRELAVGIGANAVIDVRYDSGMSMTSWHSLKATGLAVKRVADEMPCPKCAEKIKRAATVCRFCGAELKSPEQVATLSAPAGVGHRASSTATPRPHNPVTMLNQEPLRATDNSQLAIYLVFGAMIVFAIILALVN